MRISSNAAAEAARFEARASEPISQRDGAEAIQRLPEHFAGCSAGLRFQPRDDFGITPAPAPARVRLDHLTAADRLAR